jgi:hypothetical protein
VGDELTAEEIAVASKIAALDQENCEWLTDAQNMAAFYGILIQGGVPEPVANLMVLNAQANYYEADTPSMSCPICDDEDDD